MLTGTDELRKTGEGADAGRGIGIDGETGEGADAGIETGWGIGLDGEIGEGADAGIKTGRGIGIDGVGQSALSMDVTFITGGVTFVSNR